MNKINNNCFKLRQIDYLFKSDKTGSNLIKSDQVDSSRSKMVQIGLNWIKKIKMNQIDYLDQIR